MKGIARIVLFILFAACSLPVMGQATGGIGAVLMLDTAKDGSTLPRIKSLVPNSPALAQGLPEGSYIIQVNDLQCRNKKLEDVVAVIRGEPGTTVKIELADNAQGRKSKSYTITRVAIQATTPGAPPADPADAFYTACEQEVKQLKRKKFAIVKNTGSDCGDFFFSFDADTGPYHMKLFTLEVKGTGTYVKGFDATATVYESSNEAAGVQLKSSVTNDQATYAISSLEGTINMTHNSVGIVKTKINALADAGKCRAMYIVVYK
jgi:hypothetical protein